MGILARLLFRKRSAPEVLSIPAREGDALLCRRCQQPVVVNRELYDVFEQMHWLCFHLAFEHDGDPDETCGQNGCPSANEVFLDRLSPDENWRESFTTVPCTEAELEQFLREPAFLGPEEVRKVIRQARFSTYLARELLANYGGPPDDAIVRIARAALGPPG